MPGSSEAELPLPVPGERRETDGRAGRLAYYVAGEGPALLLVHSINAAASAYEVRPIFEHAARDHTVYAVDLPGYGGSDRSARNYNVRLFVDAIHDMLDGIEADSDQPIDALAVSLSCEFVARAATERPERFRSLALVTPTGFDHRGPSLRQPAGSTREIAWLYRVVTNPLWSQGLFYLLVSRRSIRFFLRKTFGSDRIDPGLMDYCYRTAHQPGAKNAPYAFLSGRLFSANIRTVYEALSLPVWLAHATRGDFRDFSDVDWARARANWSVEAFDTGALPHFEETAAFLETYDGFLAAAAAQGSAFSARSPSP
jgi:pimeloyl-ACP methyl ester carboxylesterase